MTRLTRFTTFVAVATLAVSPVAWAGAKIAHFNFRGPIAERPQDDFGLFLGVAPPTLKDLVQRMEKAKNDDNIRAVVITMEQPAFGLAQAEELMQAMKALDAAGKPVYIHSDSLSTGSYAFATAASHISVTPTGDVWLLGIHGESPYLKNLLDHINVTADFIHIGDYKSAGEMLYRTEPSEPALANLNWLIDDLYGSIVKMIADARFGGNQEKVRGIIDDGPYTAEQALKLGLIDSVEHRQDLQAKLEQKYGEDVVFVKNYGAESGPDLDFSGNPFAMFTLLQELFMGKPKSDATALGIVYVDGAIVTGSEEPSPFGGSSGAHSTTIRKALDTAANDDSIKAVVLRVDSPGGSALASEIIFDAVQRVRAAGKPVVVSMGNVAGSGGYYVSCGADRIIADPTTITASIGVVGGKLVTTSMWDSIGVNWFAFKRGESADIMTTARMWNDAERTKIRDWMTGVYGDFKGHITEHRGDKLSKPIDEMAGGRVYTGRQALDLGLVDELGTMSDAIAKAADMASVADYELRVLPKPKSLFDMFSEHMGGQQEHSIRLSAADAGSATSGLFAAESPLLKAALPILHTLDPQRAKVLVQALTRLQLIHDEHVIMMMSNDLLIRMD